MENNIFLETYTKHEDYKNTFRVSLPLESYITYCIYKYCIPEKVKLYLVSSNNQKESNVFLTDVSLEFADLNQIPWQVSSCLYPVAMCEDTIITGLCAVARHMTIYRTCIQSSKEHIDGILGFRKSCLQAPNEVSIWTKFCEVDIIKTVKEVVALDRMTLLPKNLVRFENHLSKPVRVHNVYKMARELKKDSLSTILNKLQIANDNPKVGDDEKVRTAKPRQWKSKTRKELAIDSSTKIEDLNISHQFAEGPYFTLADLVLLPSYSIIMHTIGTSVFEHLLPLTWKWYTSLKNVPEITILNNIMDAIDHRAVSVADVTVPVTEGVSLYKCDPSRHNPRKRLFTKEDDIENALSTLKEGMKFDVSANDFEFTWDWSEIPDGANPAAGHLPDARINRKSQQLENLALAVLSIAQEGDRIVDFCSGSGHLGILIAHLLPKCTVVLLENKEQSLLRARKRVHDMKLNNVFFFQCNLDFFIGKFDIGIALHACGIASDLVLDKCLKANAKFVLCPCCYGSLHSTDRLIYPRSSKFSNVNINQYLCIGHAADQTHEEHPLTIRGDLCMAVIDSDRGRLAEEFGYKVTLSRLKPLTCTPKNNLLIGVPS